MPASLTTAAAITVALAAPALVTASLEFLHGDPTLRPLGVTEARIAQADIATNDPFVRIRVFWGGPVGGYATAEALAGDLRTAFEVKGINAMIAVVDAPPGAATTLDMRAGRSVFGPLPVSQAGSHVGAAVQAARMAKRAFDADPEHRW